MVKMLLVFEGALGLLKPGAEDDWDRAVEHEQWSLADRYWFINPLMETIIWQRSMRMESLNIEVVTYAGPDAFAAAISNIIGEAQLPIRRVWAVRPEVLAHKVMSMPQVIRVYDPFEEHQLYFGSKGRWITDANQFARD
jgi:hypothetical protein